MRFLALAATLLALAPPAAAQFTPRPHLDWRTISTRHFVLHYPREMEAWTRDVASRIDAVHDAVRVVVGYAPERRITVVVDDPLNISNGSAWPLLDAPAMVLWPTPPDPSASLGNTRGWGEVLSVHELTHVAHLTRPSRDPRWRRLMTLLPARLSPVAVRSPRWMIEGYATYVEGLLTGSGRPHGVARAAVLRQWAIEGKLPTYGALDATGGPWQQGAMAYLVGSSFIEWLVEQKGDSSLAHLWRRLSARERRGFAEAFAGVYGGMPWDLYARFTAEVTARALAAEGTLRAGGLAVGDTVQRLEYGTGAPALSPNDTLVAVALRYRDRPSRIVLWRTGRDTAQERRAREARAKLLERDPEDVPSIEWRPPPKRAVAELRSVAGRSHESPRWFRDGRRILVHRSEPLGDGTWRPDLFAWDWRHGTLARITRGAGVRDGDPHPDGRTAVAQRCAAGTCDLVMVDIATGAVTDFARGTLDGEWYRPRFSPDGGSVVASRKMGGRWRLVVLDARDASRARVVDPDDGASRYDAAFAMGGRMLVATSEASGIANLELIDLATGAARPLTSVTGAALAAAPTRDGSAFYYLSMHARGLDLARIALVDGALALPALGDSLAPVARIPVAGADTFAVGPVSPPRAYGLGPRRHRLVPAGGTGAEGSYGQLALVSTDPVGRLTWMLQGALGERGTWRGAGLGAAWRGWRPDIAADAWYAEQRPSRQGEGALPPSPLDADYAGASAIATLHQDYGARQLRWRAGATAGALRAAGGERESRALALADVAGSVVVRRERNAIALAGSLHGAAGRTAGEGWWRGVGAAEASGAVFGWRLRATGLYGQTSRDAPAYETMAAGGMPSPLFDPVLLSQRVSHPAIPLGYAAGRRLAMGRAAVELGGVEAYLWTVSAGEELDRWRRVVGAEWRFGVASIPLVHLPNASAVVGVGHSIDEPMRRETRGYLSVRFRP